MPVEDHLKVAATELTRAADLVKQEIDRLRSHVHDLSTLADKETAQLMSQLQLHEQELRKPDSDSSAIQRFISDLRNQIANRKSDVEKQRKQIEDDIRAKQGMIQQLQSQSNNIKP